MEVKAATAQNGAKGYPALDIFRVVAAFLVVAIHTSPLLGISETGDFLFTRVLARLAVPFFFMASGFFLLPGGQRKESGARLKAFCIKIAKLYGLAILLYLPLNLYAGYFSRPGLAGQLLRDVLFNGSFYHLWYFPAVLLGSVIAWALYRYTKPAVAFAVTAALYLVGLGGDSYYGLVTRLPALHTVYDAMFRLFEYTRNGFFFAPLFILMGLYLAGRPAPAKRRTGLHATGLVLSLAAMAAEGLALQYSGALGVPRHDSMYLALPLCVWCLFCLLAGFRGKSHPTLRRFSLLVFLLHPWCIVLVRGAAKAVGLSEFIIGNSLLFYLCVCAATAVLCWLLCLLANWWRGRKTPQTPPRAWAEVDPDALTHNLHEMQSLVPAGCRVMAVVKTDAYGMGGPYVARVLQKQGVGSFAVATLAEGIALRKNGIRGEILVLGYTPPEQARLLRRYSLTQTVVDMAHARALNDTGYTLPVHIKVDTGMHRLGIPYTDIDDIAAVYALPCLRVQGIYSHHCTADSLGAKDMQFAQLQTARFEQVLAALRAQDIPYGSAHMLSTYGVLNHPEAAYDCVRVGLGLYGCLSSLHSQVSARPALQPVLSLRARVASVRTLPAGETVGYGRTWRGARSTRIATLAIGYADGVPRAIQGGHVLLHGAPAPIVGRISMDQMAVDVTDIEAVASGDVATLIGKDDAVVITAEQFAAWCGTITNEVLCRIGARVQRVYPSHPTAGKAPATQPQATPATLHKWEQQKTMHTAG